MPSARLIVLLFLLAAVLGCNRDDDPVDSTATRVPSRAAAPASATARVHPTAPGLDLTLTATAISGSVAPTLTPIPDHVDAFDAAMVLGQLMIDLPIQPYEHTIFAMPPCGVGNTPLTPDGIFLGTVPLPTPTPSPNSSSGASASVSADEVAVQRYIKTVYPSLDTALGWARAVDDVDIESLDGRRIRALLHMESIRLDAVCRAVALIPETTAAEAFSADLANVLLFRHSALGDVRDITSSGNYDATQIVFALTRSLAKLEQLDDDLEVLADAYGLDYPPPLAGLILSNTDLGIELSIPPGWQLTGVTGKLSLLAPPRMQGGGLQDVGTQFGANGSSFAFSHLRNPSGFDERDALDRVERLLQPFGELISETRGKVASLDGHVLDYFDQEQGQSTKVWVVSGNGFSNIFRISCPADLIDLCVGDVLPMVSSATITE